MYVVCSSRARAKAGGFDGHRLRATFSDGMAVEYDFAAIVKEGGPMVEPLRELTYFAARVML